MDPEPLNTARKTGDNGYKLPPYMQDSPAKTDKEQIFESQVEAAKAAEDIPHPFFPEGGGPSDTPKLPAEPLMATQDGLKKHREEASARLSSMGRKFFDLIEYDENEQLVLEIRKHPFGLLIIWVVGIFVSLILLFIPILVAAFLSSTNVVGISAASVSSAQVILFVVGIVLGISGLVVTFINSILYKNNVIFVTSEKLAQIVYTSLFNRKISQLSIGDLQDVTVRQKGIFPRAFNFGTLTIETAGEQSNLIFGYVPAPYDSSKLIVGAHEANLHRYGN